MTAAERAFERARLQQQPGADAVRVELVRVDRLRRRVKALVERAAQ